MMFSPRMFYQSAVCMGNDFAAFESVPQSGSGDLAGAVLRHRGPACGSRVGFEVGPMVCCCLCVLPKWEGWLGVPQQRGWLPRAAGLGGVAAQLAVERSEALGFPPPQCPSSAGQKCFRQ